MAELGKSRSGVVDQRRGGVVAAAATRPAPGGARGERTGQIDEAAALARAKPQAMTAKTARPGTARAKKALPPRKALSADALQMVLVEHEAWLASGGRAGARAVLAGALLSGLSFWRANLRQADLRGADLRRANLDHAQLDGAILRGGDLTGASLWGASLADADLARAKLTGCKCDHADLRNADLRAADLNDASLWGAHLEGAELTRATGVTARQLEPAKCDAQTRLPKSISS